MAELLSPVRLGTTKSPMRKVQDTGSFARGPVGVVWQHVKRYTVQMVQLLRECS